MLANLELKQFQSNLQVKEIDKLVITEIEDQD